jgi:tetratricopeptide (TPR) repeat protein
LTFIAVPFLVYYLLKLWYHWLRPDPAFLAFSAGIAQVLTIASFLGLQTEPGKRLALRLDELLGLRRLLSTPRRVCLAVWSATAIAALAFYAGSPLAAYLFDRHGAAALERGQYSVAMRDFRQAVSLASGNARTHYNLASACEALHNDEDAIDEYQAALELDESFWPASNNLGRLFLQARHDPHAALGVLLAAQQRVVDPLGQAVIGKNVAWAYLEKGLPRAALAGLDKAIADLRALQAQGKSVENYLADAHRLEALAYQALNRPDDARRVWQDSLGYALAVAESESCAAKVSPHPPDCLDALRWAAEAREWLAGDQGGP